MGNLPGVKEYYIGEGFLEHSDEMCLRFAIMFLPVIVTGVAIIIALALALANRPFESRSASSSTSANITNVLE